MPSKRDATTPVTALQALAALRRHSRDCRNLEAREYLWAVERRLVQLIDLQREHPQGDLAAD
ncbi:hypothetical protein [Azospirillum sp. sgz302134]